VAELGQEEEEDRVEVQAAAWEYFVQTLRVRGKGRKAQSLLQ